MIDYGLNIDFQRSWQKGGWEVWARIYHQDGTRVPVKITVELAKPSEPGMPSDPSCIVPDGMNDAISFDHIINALKAGMARAGFLQEIGPVEGELKATKFHLEDMRKIAHDRWIVDRGAKL